MNLLGLHVVAVGAGIADMGIGQSDDLPAIGRVRQDFLVAGHRGIEDELRRWSGRRRRSDVP